MTTSQLLESSFRDPSGFLFTQDGILYRQVNRSYAHAYDQLLGSGLCDSLTAAGLLIPHTEVNIPPAEADLAYKTLQPEHVAFISYPYEWSFSQLKDAALATLEVQKRALAAGMTLKDSSAYNIQFHHGRPLLIDTLSFDIYQDGKPWDAYRQFCQHFLAPLALMSLVDIRLGQLLRVYVDGIPLDLASRLLPGRTRLNFGLLSHIHLHASAQRRYAGRSVEQATSTRRMGKTSFLGLIDGLESAVRKLSWEPTGTEWGDYYPATSQHYSNEALEHKKLVVADYLTRLEPTSAWDLGANTGLFSRIASDRGIMTVAYDVDPAAVELNYQQCVARQERYLLPLLLDLTNPSPNLGWHNRERMSFYARGPVDVILALALVHHLAIANNVPLARLATFFRDLARGLIIEFVPKEDSQVQRLLASRADIFPDYTIEGFEAAFSPLFRIRASEAIRGTARRLYLMEAR